MDRIGEERTILYVIISDMDSTFNFLVSIMYTQLFITLCDKALELYGGALPLNVCFMLDEFANIGQIPDFDKKLTTIRSRGITANVILQSKSQLKNIYKDQAETIFENCDTTLFLGSGGKDTLKEIEERLGKETIYVLSNTVTRGSSETGPLLHPMNAHNNDANQVDNNESINDNSRNSESATDTKEEVAKAGKFISYKKKYANEIKDNILQPDKYPLHKAFLGHKVGDVVYFMGKEYEIIGL